MSFSFPLVLVAAATLVGACTDAVSLRNARPRITWLAIDPVAAGDPRCPDSVCAAVTFWVADAEGEAVDVTAEWVAGGDRGALALAPGSHPLSAVPTRIGQADIRGVPHTIIWMLDEVPTGDVVLELSADDSPHKGDDGDVYATPPLDPAATVAPVTLQRR